MINQYVQGYWKIEDALGLKHYFAIEPLFYRTGSNFVAQIEQLS